MSICLQDGVAFTPCLSTWACGQYQLPQCLIQYMHISARLGTSLCVGFCPTASASSEWRRVVRVHTFARLLAQLRQSASKAWFARVHTFFGCE